MKLIAYDGNFRVGSCCAKPHNRVRYAGLAEIVVWIADNDAWEAILEAAVAAPNGDDD